MENPEAVAWLEEQIQYGEPGPAEGFGIPAAFAEGLEVIADAVDPIEGYGTGEVRGLIATMERSALGEDARTILEIYQGIRPSREEFILSILFEE